MSALFIILIIIGIILAVTGGLVHALSVLLYIGIIVAVIAAIVWLVRFITGSRRA